MLVRDLVTLLQQLDERESNEFGPAEIMIDMFKPASQDKDEHNWVYAGFDKDIMIDRSSDGVYPLLVARGTFNS